MSKPAEYVTTRELASEIRAVRWEMRAIAATQVGAVLAAAYKLKLPPVHEAVTAVLGLLGV